jgi:hypothetical protein
VLFRSTTLTLRTSFTGVAGKEICAWRGSQIRARQAE